MARNRWRSSWSYRQQFVNYPRGDEEPEQERPVNGRVNIPQPRYATRLFLEAAAFAVRSYGWQRSKDQYGEKNYDATWRVALEITNQSPEVITQEDMATADDVLNWRVPFAEGEYLPKVMAVLQQPDLGMMDLGIAASAIIAYRRFQDQQVAKDARHVGTVGERIEFNYLKLISTKWIASEWGGNNLYKFVDGQGNHVTYFSGQSYEEGKIYKGKARVKAHGEFNGVKETTITRANLDVLETCSACGGRFDQHECTCIDIAEGGAAFEYSDFDIML